MRALLLNGLYGGQLFFAAVILFTGVAILDVSGWLDRHALARRVTGFFALLTIPLAVLCGPPIPLAVAMVALAATLGYLFFGFGAQMRLRRGLGATAAGMCLIVATLEVPYHLRRSHGRRPSRVFVIGDSLASGGLGEQTPWPGVLGRETALPVTNLALAAADTKMALERQVPQLPVPADDQECVVIEIGGNDMLGGVGPEQFASALDLTLRAASADDRRRLIMLELPVIPGRWSYGRIQRRLAARHHCTLVPKRVLAKVLLGAGNTFDGIHLTQQGHNELARALETWLSWRLTTPTSR